MNVSNRALLPLVLGLLLCTQAGQAAPAAQRPQRLDRVAWLGGEWFLLGYNYPWHDYNNDFLADAPGSVRANYARIDGQLADLRAYGTHVTRWYVFNDASAYPTFDAQGRVSGLAPEFLRQFDAALALASANGIYLIPVLLDGESLLRRDNGAAHPGVLADATVRQTFLERAVRPLLERYGHHPAILAWSLLNEPEYFTEGLNVQPDRRPLPREVVADYLREAAALVHRHASQPVALDVGLPWLAAWPDAGIDLYLGHWYPWMNEYWGQFSPYTRAAATLGVERPVAIGEFATAATPYTVQQSLDAFYANGYAGALAWSYPNNSDQWSNYAGTRESFRAWEQSHLSEVNIAPAGETPGLAAASPCVLADWETPGDVEGWAVDWGSATVAGQRGGQQRNGRGALVVRAWLAGSGWQDFAIARSLDAPRDLSRGSNTLRVRVWLPHDAPAGLLGQVGLYDAQRRLQLGPEIPLSAGRWTTVLWAGAPLTATQALVVSVGGKDLRFQGDVWIDYLTVQ